MNELSPTTLLIDATMIPESRGGVGRFIDAIVPALSNRTDLKVVVLCQTRDESWFRSASKSRVIAAPTYCANPFLRLIWEQFRLPRMAIHIKADMVLSPHYTFPLLTRLPRIVVIHDLTFFTHPRLHTRIKRVFFRTWIRLVHRSRVEVIVPSQATADELSRIIGMPRSRVAVAPLAVDPEAFHRPTGDELDRFTSSRESLPHGWIAFLGTLEPRKNVSSLIAAYEQLAASAEPLPALLLAGGPGWDHEAVLSIERAMANGLDVRRLGYLPIDQLSAFLGAAKLVAYPSLGEGFGLPVLEAMATGACILTTRQLSLPEVGGDAVAYSETSAQALAEAIGSLLGDQSRRAALGDAALLRSRQFTWSRTADAIVTVVAKSAGARP